MSSQPQTNPAKAQGTGPIQHVVIIVKENHAFDNYFGKYPGVEGDPTLPAAQNPPPSDPLHTHEAWLVRASKAPRGQYDGSVIPAYWAYARQFTLCDHYFTDVAGPSTPNHLMLIAAASPIINNPHYYDPKKLRPPYKLPSLPDLLQKAGLTWANYGGYAFHYITALRNSTSNRTSQQFAVDAAAGKLPTVSWVYAPEILHNPDPLSEHPPGNVTDGMNWTVAQVNAIVKGGLWPNTAIFITWDDWGGWYDHIDPPMLEKWSDGTQFRLGTRVGCLVLSPYTRQGYISKTQKSHVSLVRFCEKIFNLPTLNQRDAAADDMLDCFDFTQKAAPPPSAV
jgi:phospholipase C